ncbi:succinylglutamate desuccinylase/aspartoacylase family protein [Winogradskyella bathintestinalis]|uniref:Succinylglutamate desuccinylase/aspartoacylase family protein n=1 Tax=Winogradskyella bathintestinalis TaxID=3035208 RepID=A0ABT7ZS18_9FLAO|nr:succinylglutamate desuccinylase/aspartoacylase family protein [Winogradskyella bathintestinalis]MDN3491786.1 succinylglutamate desuccinylase/aspartoacylase family protein [Winogradskyella bathintestinalis]
MIKKDILHILGKEVALGESAQVSFNVAKLHTQNTIDVPVIIERSKKPGPIVLITAGIHGDEVNGVEIVRQIISKGINKPKRGTIICIPVINVFGFIHMDREFPDGRDLNRMFPGIRGGSLASRVAFKLVTEILPHADLVLDFHTGGADRFNAAQVRIIKGEKTLNELAKVFGAPFIFYSKNLKKSFRNTCHKLGIPILLFEGGKSFNIDNTVTNTGVNGVKRVLHHLEMLNRKFKVSNPKKSCIYIKDSKWVRAKYSGMFKATVSINSEVKKGDDIGNITDPYGSFNHFVKAPNDGYIFNINESPIIYQGDAIFHISTKFES